MSPKVTQAHVDARRQQIFEAAVAVFARKGVRNTTIRDICGEAGLSTGAMYNYFAGKREIILAMAEQSRERNAGLLAGDGGEGRSWAEIVDGLTGYFSKMLEELNRESPHRAHGAARLDLELWAETVADDEFRLAMRAGGAAMLEPLAKAIIAEQGAGRMRADLEPDLGAQVVLGALLGGQVLLAMEPEMDFAGYITELGNLLKNLGQAAPAASPNDEENGS
jgi:AcrR family transcriptional regulator